MVNVQKKHTLLIKSVVLTFGLIVSGQVLSSDINMLDIDEMQAQRVLYEAKAAVNKAKIAAGEDTGLPSFSPTPVSDSSTFQAPVSSLPRLAKVSGKKAEMVLPNGESTIVTVGMMLPGGQWQVQGIGLSGVTIKNTKTAKVTVIN